MYLTETLPHTPVKAIVSPGGAGCSYLKKHLGPMVLKTHQRYPSVQPGSTILYLMSHPYDTIISFFKRGFMSRPGYGHAKHIGAGLDVLDKKNSWTLEEFLALEEDPFQLFGHISNWFGVPHTNWDFLFVKYEHLPENMDIIYKYFDVTPTEPFEFKQRDSDWTLYPPEIQNGLHKNYRKVAKFYEQLGPVF